MKFTSLILPCVFVGIVFDATYAQDHIGDNAIFQSHDTDKDAAVGDIHRVLPVYQSNSFFFFG